MNKILCILFSLFAMTSFAQNDIAADTGAKPAITEKGKPDGEKTTTDINKEGGTLASSDGKLELIISPGALTKKTTISIHPIHNCMPNGNGKAYRLEPSGIHFQQPVKLLFHYTSEESKDSMQLLLGIATQDDNGQWYGLKNFTLDTVAKTLTGNIPHFSDWSDFEALRIFPADARVKVNKELDLTIDMIDDEDELYPLVHPSQADLYMIKRMKIKWKATWTVDGINNGNNTEGWITKQNITDATYKAPAMVPDRNPVTVAAKLHGIKYKFNGTVFKDLSLVSNVLVYDNQYKVEMSAINHNGLIGHGALNADLVDYGSFVVSMEGKRTRVIDIKNNLYEFTNNSGMDIVYVNEATCTGPIHITGVRELRVTKPDPPKQPYQTVEILFMPAKLVMPQFRVKGKDVPLPPMMNMLPAWPMFIKFVAKEGEQTIFENDDSGSGAKILFTVKQVDE